MGAVIFLSDGSKCLVDPEDMVRVTRHSWCPSKNGNGQVYAQTRTDGKTLYMHRLIMMAPRGIIVDHRNGDPLDNRKANLRFVSKSENSINSRSRPDRTYSNSRGVTFDRSRGKWKAQLKAGGKAVLQKRFDTEAEAVAAYTAAAALHHGDFRTGH